MMNHPINIPIEVKLVSEVRNCRQCQWFWGGIPPYGGFPQFDWLEDFPEKVRKQKQTTARYASHPGPDGCINGLGQVDPGIMHGCRKAPIMTIGINPNMTAYFKSMKSAQWSYPHFSRDARYAYYYRYHNVYQESIGIETVRKHTIEGTQIVAKHDGKLLSVKRSTDHRWALLVMQYNGIKETEEIEVAWTDKTHFVVLVSAGKRFRKDDLLAAQVGGDILEKQIRLQENATGYYQRFLHVLDQFKQQAGAPLSNADLSISEDVCQHDLVACASPGWNSNYDLPQDRIAHNCLADKGWFLQQLVQTNPAIVVVVGKSTAAMLWKFITNHVADLDIYAEASGPGGKKQRVLKDVYQLLKETTEISYFIEINTPDFSLKSRLLISPHFSYEENFIVHSRLSLNTWLAFEKDFPGDATLLHENNCIGETTWDNKVPIRLDKHENIKGQLSLVAKQVLEAYHYAPYDMLASALFQEHQAGRIIYQHDIGRLKRNDGACHFCNNSLWQLPGGCLYGKDQEGAESAYRLETIARGLKV